MVQFKTNILYNKNLNQDFLMRKLNKLKKNIKDFPNNSKILQEMIKRKMII